MRVALLLAASLMLTGCEPKSAADSPGAILVLELDTDLLRTAKLRQLSTDIREELRLQPMIPLDPIDGRKVEGDHLVVVPGNREHIPATIQRIGRLGEISVVEAESGTVEINFTEAGFRKEVESALSLSAEAVKRRIELSGYRNPTIEAFDTRIIARVPRMTDAEDIAILGSLIGRAGVLTFNLVDVSAIPTDYEVGVERNGRMALPDDSLDGELQVIFADPIIHGDEIAKAQQGWDERSAPDIEFELTPDGARKFARATTEHIGRPFAIVFDNRIVSAPVIMSPIKTGNGRITGSFSEDEAEQMAVIMRSGALPAPLRLIGTRVVDDANEKQ